MTLQNTKKEKSLPTFELISTEGVKVTNKSIVGQNTVFFLYPKNNTPSCTEEAKGFSDQVEKFKSLNTVIFGISIDSVKSHKSFILKHSLNIDLLSDEKHEFINSMGAWVEKRMYGKIYFGTERTTILVSSTANIIKIWRKVKIPGHVSEVFDVLQNTLNKG